jgi:hypothetical protein
MTYSAEDKGAFTDADLMQLQELLALIPRVKETALDNILKWVEGDTMPFYKGSYPTGVDWLIDNLKRYYVSS